MNVSIDDQIEIFRLHCYGFGYEKGTHINKSSFVITSGRYCDRYTYNEVVGMVKELSLALQIGKLSICQKSILHQLKSCGVIEAFRHIAEIEEDDTPLERYTQ